MDTRVNDPLLRPTCLRCDHWSTIGLRNHGLDILPPSQWLEADCLSHATSSYPTEVPFPQLDAFPHELFGTSEQTLGIRTALMTTSETGARLKDIGRLISRAIEVELREALLNDLGELGEAYEEGWQGGSESDGDQ